jgi:hypothetical protein
MSSEPELAKIEAYINRIIGRTRLPNPSNPWAK